MPLTDGERNAIRLEVYNAMQSVPRREVFTSVYGSERIGVLEAHFYFISKPSAFQRQLLIMVAERQTFTQTVGSQSITYQERCRDTDRKPNFWGTDALSGEEFLNEMREYTIHQKPALYRLVFLGVFRTTFATTWSHWISIKSGNRNPHQTEVGLLNYEKTSRWNLWIHDWRELHDFIVGTGSGSNITYGLLPQLWVDAIDAMEPAGTTGALLQSRTPPPVYIFSLDTLPELDKNTFVMVDLSTETPPATFQNLLATKVKSRGKSVVFNALYSQSDRQKVERRRVLANPTTVTHRWDNSSYTWTPEGEANTGREIVYETKNYLTLSQAMTILNNL